MCRPKYLKWIQTTSWEVIATSNITFQCQSSFVGVLYTCAWSMCKYMWCSTGGFKVTTSWSMCKYMWCSTGGFKVTTSWSMCKYMWCSTGGFKVTTSWSMCKYMWCSTGGFKVTTSCVFFCRRTLKNIVSMVT